PVYYFHMSYPVTTVIYTLSLHDALPILWNACVETNIPIKEWCKFFDTVSLCLSKGLGAGIGSVLVGTREHIEKARAFRKLYGGRSEEHTSELQSRENLVCRLLLEKKKQS